MAIRLITAASVLALVSACSSQPGPSSLSPTQLADEALRAVNFQAAEQGYLNVLAGNPSNSIAMLGLAEVYDATGRTAQATDLFARVSAEQSGAIRVWDGGSQQIGVTEVASRRLGELRRRDGGHFDAPQVVAPVVQQTFVAPAPVSPAPFVQTGVLSESPTYALESSEVVYYSDSEAAPPVPEYVLENPVVVEQTLPRGNIQYAAPIHEPAVAVQTIAQPQAADYALDSDGIVYFSGSQATTETVFESREVVEKIAPAVTRQSTTRVAPIAVAPVIPSPVRFVPAPAPQPIAYEPAPIVPAPVIQPIAPTPVAYAPAPISYEAPSIVTPLPVRAPVSVPSAAVPTGALPRSQPGYAVVNGDFVYISAEDIARGAVVQPPVGNAEAYGVPTPIASPRVPSGTSQTYTAPNVPRARSSIELNGIPSIDLN